MAGSLNHIVMKDGSFSMRFIENMGDAHEALEQCFDLLAFLVSGDDRLLAEACEAVNAPIPEAVPRLGARSEDGD